MKLLKRLMEQKSKKSLLVLIRKYGDFRRPLPMVSAT